MNYELDYHRHFLKDAKRLKQSGYKMQKLEEFFLDFQKGPPFPHHYHVHPLTGDMSGIWDAHLSENWVILFRYRGKGTIELIRTGTHASLGLS